MALAIHVLKYLLDLLEVFWNFYFWVNPMLIINPGKYIKFWKCDIFRYINCSSHSCIEILDLLEVFWNFYFWVNQMLIINPGKYIKFWKCDIFRYINFTV